MIAKENKIPLLYTSILYICGLLLFLEWLYPIEELVEIANLQIFIVYTIGCFFISIFNMKWWLSSIFKGTGLLLIVHYLSFNDPFSSQSFLSALYIELSFNIKILFTQNWYELTDIFRSILFLVLIWLISYLIHYWFIVVKRIFLFILLTFIYIALLDTFTLYDAGLSMIRTFIISFIAFGMANVFKEINHEHIQFSWFKKMHAWLIPILGMVLFTTIIGYATPKFDPQWPDPLPYLGVTAEGFSGFGESTDIRKVGYGEDDSVLGGSLMQDDTPVFQAVATKKHYWRIEDKDVYTGKGWLNSEARNYEDINDRFGSLITFTGNVETEELEAYIHYEEGNTVNKLVYPYGLSEVEILAGSELLYVHFGAIKKEESHRDERYKLVYQNPLFDITVLRSVSEADPRDLHDQYTDLPSTLPSRINDLAKEITKVYDNRYDKTRAIEQYFGRNGFKYELSDVPIPKEDEDYVDQFLFETKFGYCDNYSTAMIVMLRTLDIPARWVKGFTGGEKISADTYEVTNANAHSWVEVYFPEIGWVPFEPTQGFSNLAEFAEPSIDVEVPEENDTEPVEIEVPEQEPHIPETKETEETVGDTQGVKEPFQLNGWYIVSGLFIFLLLLFVIYKLRFRLRTKFLLRKLRKKDDGKTYEEAYHHLLAILSRHVFAKEPEQTLREYAKEIDLHYGSMEMGLLTNYYEQMLYNNKTKEIKEGKRVELWSSLMKRVHKK